MADTRDRSPCLTYLPAGHISGVHGVGEGVHVVTEVSPRVLDVSADFVGIRHGYASPLTAGTVERSLVCLPLLSGNRALGAIALVFPGQRLPDGRELSFLITRANACAQVLERIHAQQQAADRAAKLDSWPGVRRVGIQPGLPDHARERRPAGGAGTCRLVRRGRRMQGTKTTRLDLFRQRIIDPMSLRSQSTAPLCCPAVFPSGPTESTWSGLYRRPGAAFASLPAPNGRP